MQTEEGVLDDVLRFVTGKPEANEIAKQGSAQFAVQGISFGVGFADPRACTRGQARKRQRDRYGITRHGVVGMRCSSLRFSRITTEGVGFTGRDEKDASYIGMLISCTVPNTGDCPFHLKASSGERRYAAKVCRKVIPAGPNNIQNSNRR